MKVICKKDIIDYNSIVKNTPSVFTKNFIYETYGGFYGEDYLYVYDDINDTHAIFNLIKYLESFLYFYDYFDVLRDKNLKFLNESILY